MIDIEKLSKKLGLSFMQTVEIKESYKDIEALKTIKLNDEQMLLFVLSSLKLDEHQVNILNKNFQNFDRLIKVCLDLELKDIKENVKPENENALIVLCCKLLIMLNKNEKVNLKNVHLFIVETFEVLNKYQIYDALVTKYVIIKESY